MEAGNTIVVIEHNLEVMKCADWIIDLGPEAGDEGGELVAAGTPEQVAKVEASHTGRYLKPLLDSPEEERAPFPSTSRYALDDDEEFARAAEDASAISRRQSSTPFASTARASTI